MSEVPDFSPVAEAYAQARPGYPPELFAWLAGQSPGRELAWDTATGSGQAAVGVAEHFARVVATDVSEAQLRHARTHPRVEYRVGRAEASGLADGSVDLAVSAAAIHWFDLPSYYAELRRVLRPGGVMAAWSYHVGRVSAPFGEALWPFYRDIVGPYFAPGARMVDAGYAAIEFPGTPLTSPVFESVVHWTLGQTVEFIRTWSGVHAYLEATGEDPVPPVERRLRSLFGSPDEGRELRFPLHLRVSRLSP
jgi:ubiquinone/menaquinone biosynthesis C-methylase UbiE